MAYIYKTLKEKSGITTGLSPDFCMVEGLSGKFEPNSFDIVNMSNSLDHSFNAVFGIFQLLYICKIGGKVILQHVKNEAENENYTGFHQWNLCVEDNNFIIWRQNKKYNVSSIISNFAEIIVEETNDNWVGVVIKKKKEIKIDIVLEKKIVSIINSVLFERLSNYVILSVYDTDKLKDDKSKTINKGKMKRFIVKIPVIGHILRRIYKAIRKR